VNQNCPILLWLWRPACPMIMRGPNLSDHPFRSPWVTPRHLGMKIPGADHRDDRSFKASAN